MEALDPYKDEFPQSIRKLIWIESWKSISGTDKMTSAANTSSDLFLYPAISRKYLYYTQT